MKITVVICSDHGEVFLFSDEDKSLFYSSGCCPKCGKIPKQVKSVEKEIRDSKKKKTNEEV